MRDSTPTEYLLSLANKLAEPYKQFPETYGILLTGSVAEGIADCHSDIDMAIYYEELPTAEQLDHAMMANGARERKWVVGDPSEEQFMEAYLVNDVECQLVHTTLDAWERDLGRVLSGEEAISPLQKALSGVLEGISLHGDGLIRDYKERIADYPDELAEKMVREHLKFYPLWKIEDRLGSRDASLWKKQIATETIQNLLGVLAGLNRVYYTTFQFKRMKKFIDSMLLSPSNLYERINGVLATNDGVGYELENLVSETLELVRREMPQIDVAPTAESIGLRSRPWTKPIHAQSGSRTLRTARLS